MEVVLLLPLSAVQRCFLWGFRQRGQDAVVTVTQLQVNKAEVSITDVEAQVCELSNVLELEKLF